MEQEAEVVGSWRRKLSPRPQTESKEWAISGARQHSQSLSQGMGSLQQGSITPQTVLATGTKSSNPLAWGRHSHSNHVASDLSVSPLWLLEESLSHENLPQFWCQGNFLYLLRSLLALCLPESQSIGSVFGLVVFHVLPVFSSALFRYLNTILVHFRTLSLSLQECRFFLLCLFFWGLYRDIF